MNLSYKNVELYMASRPKAHKNEEAVVSKQLHNHLDCNLLDYDIVYFLM